jgi:hypothetical protein
MSRSLPPRKTDPNPIGFGKLPAIAEPVKAENAVAHFKNSWIDFEA